MKRILALLLCLCMSFTLAACGGGQSQPEPASAASASAAAEASASVEEPETDPADASVPDESAPDLSRSSSSGLQPPETIETVAGISFTTESVSAPVTNEDGVVLVDVHYEIPTITIPDNEEVQAIIQAELDAIVAASDDTDSMAEIAQDDYNYRKEEGLLEDSEFYPYYSDLTFDLKRADDQAISLVVSCSGYTGGAHGWTSQYTLNYDGQTGAQLTFADLGEGFREKAEELVLAQADAMQAEAESKGEGIFLFENYADDVKIVVADGTERWSDIFEGMEDDDSTLSASWYLTEDAVVFIAGEYIMKPYAGGIVEFPVPFADFGDSFNGQYS